MLLREVNGTFEEGWGWGLKSWLRELRTPFQQAVDLARQTAQAMQQAFSDFFFDAMQGKLKSLTDYVNSVLAAIQRSVANALSQAVTGGTGGFGGIIGAIAGWFGTRSGASGSVTPTPPTNLPPGVQIAHTGGSIARYIPVFHLGGLNSDERMVINRVGERYITEEQNEWLTGIARAARGGAGGDTNVNIQMENKTGLPLGLRETGRRTDDRTKTKTLVLELAYSDPDFLNAFKGALSR